MMARRHPRMARKERWGRGDSRSTGVGLMLMFAACLVLTARAQTPPSIQTRSFHRNIAHDDVRFSGGVLGDITMLSKMKCFQHCSYTAGCVMVSVYRSPSGGPSRCRLHWRLQVLSSNDTAELWPGARTFLLAEGWLGAECSGACSAAPTWAGSATCFRNRCSCTPGYYYSLSRLSCVPSCSKLSGHYLLYKDKALQQYDIYNLTSVTDVKQCKAHCSQLTTCLFFVHIHNLSKCYFKNATPLQDPPKWIDPIDQTYKIYSYQRTCM